MLDKSTKLKKFKQKVTEGRYRSQRGAVIALSRTVMTKAVKAKARKFIEEYFAKTPIKKSASKKEVKESKNPTPTPTPKSTIPILKPDKLFTDILFLTSFTKICKDEKQCLEIREFLFLARNLGYTLSYLITAFDEISRGTGMHEFEFVENKPGTFRNTRTGDIVNVRDL